MLPARVQDMEYDMNDENTEKVTFSHFDEKHDPRAGARGHTQAYDDDEDDEEEGMHGHGPGVQCATQ